MAGSISFPSLPKILDLDFLGLQMGHGLCKPNHSPVAPLRLCKWLWTYNLPRWMSTLILKSFTLGFLHSKQEVPSLLAALLCPWRPSEPRFFSSIEFQLKQFQKLGVPSIKEAFEVKNCWAYLKAIASRPSISM